jgi:FkbM family methyltransferase
MGFIGFAKRLIENYTVILTKTNLKNKRLALFLNYSKINIKNLFHKIFKTEPKEESFLNFKVHFTDYSLFSNLFEDIFLKQEYYLDAKSERPVIIDCGSNIGMSLLFFRGLFKNAKIIGFEADKDTFKILKENSYKNKINTELHNAAVYNKNGFVDFYKETEIGGGLGSSISKRLFERNISPIKTRIKCVRLSDYIPKKVDILKLDIEGAEAKVIEELEKKKKLRNIDSITLEYHYNPTNKENSLEKILKMLKRNGFRVLYERDKIPQKGSYNLNILAKRN